MRFPGFGGEWEVKKLSDIAVKVNSGKTPLGGEAAYAASGIPFIRSQNVNNGQLELKAPVFISELTNGKMKNSIVKANDILLNITGASLGRSCVVPENFEVGNVNQHVCIIRLNKANEPRFLQPILDSEKGQTIFKTLQTGSGREGLNFESIKGIRILMPSLEEQGKISIFLRLIDSRIQTQSKIINNLESLINSLTKKLISRHLRFNEDGHNYPNWKKKKLREILTVGSGKDYKHLVNGNVPVFGTGGLMTYVDGFLYDGETVCIGRKGTIDKPMYYNGKIWTVDTLFYTHSFTESVPRFIYHTFRVINWKEYNEASGVPSLSKTTIEKIEIWIPCYQEQTKIAGFLSTIDEKINIEKQLLLNYQTQKKYLLDKLFI